MLFCAKKVAEKLAYSSFFSYLCKVVKRCFNALTLTQLTLFINNLKTHDTMNKTVRKVLQILGYIIAVLLGAGGGTLMN